MIVVKGRAPFSSYDKQCSNQIEIIAMIDKKTFLAVPEQHIPYLVQHKTQGTLQDVA